MIDFARDVIKFNRDILGIRPDGRRVLTPVMKEWLCKALREEVDEFEAANEDYIGHVDALVDLIYFAVGGLYKLGLDAGMISQCAHKVHDCNMKKKLGVKESRGDGSVPDAIKDSDFESPEMQLKVVVFSREPEYE
jgi:hypothetical protein